MQIKLACNFLDRQIVKLLEYIIYENREDGMGDDSIPLFLKFNSKNNILVEESTVDFNENSDVPELDFVLSVKMNLKDLISSIQFFIYREKCNHISINISKNSNRVLISSQKTLNIYIEALLNS